MLFMLMFVTLSCLFIAALWSPAGKGLSSWLLFVMFNCVFVTFPFGILGQVWFLIVSIPYHCCLSYIQLAILSFIYIKKKNNIDNMLWELLQPQLF